MKFFGSLFFIIGLFALLVMQTDVFAATIENPLGDKATSIPQLVNRVIKALFGISGTAALVMFLYGGFVWMTAMGEDKKIKNGWDTMVWAALGLAVIFGSYAIVNFVLEALIKAV